MWYSRAIESWTFFDPSVFNAADPVRSRAVVETATKPSETAERRRPPRRADCDTEP
jgi:hypothetical protein